MSQKIKANRDRQKSGRTKTLLWIVGMGLIISLLIYFEQTAILYVLATLGVTALLVIVAFSDLKGADRPASELTPEPYDDAAALGTGIGSTIPAAGTPRAPRPAKRR